MAQVFNSREQELRQEFKQQQMGGIPLYSQWLEQKLIATETEKGFVEMAAEKNYQCWQAAEDKLEKLRWDGA